MRGVLASHGSRKRLNTDYPVAHRDMGSQSIVKPSLLTSLAHNTSGSVQPSGASGPQRVYYSSAAFNANDISSDQRILQVTEEHLFSAILKSTSAARGSNYLRQHLYEEVLAQQRKTPHNFEQTVLNSISALNKGFQSLHPFNLDVLQGVQLVVAFVDFETQRLQVASNGGCRCVLGRSLPSGSLEPVEIVADIGRADQEAAKDSVVPISSVANVTLDSSIDFMVLASTGFWKEVAAFKALLRLHHIVKNAPYSSNGSAAANLINYSLHCVTQRMKTHSDRRMVSLNSVSNLVSLQSGHKGQFKYGHKQPVRRRRGDVHGDLTILAAFFDWQGLCKCQSTPQGVVSQPKVSRWDTVRMVMRFIQDSRRHNLRVWQDLVAQSKEAMAKGLISNSTISRTSAESSESDASVFQD